MKRCTTSFWYGPGLTQLCRAGALVADDAPEAKLYPSLFVPVAGPVVEQATAAPGEKRAKPPAKKPPAKKAAAKVDG